MKNTKFYMTAGVLVSMLMSANVHAVPAAEPMYKFLPSDTVVENVKTSLQSHGIDTSNLQVDSDAKGVVQLSGLVASKQDAEVATQIAKQSDGVYAVLGQWRYELAAVPVDSDAAQEKTAPASSGEAVQSETQ
ncbi:BON domain-containing protein [Methylophilus flavus]|uniref:BON domain-containing protein n=1 Tax=Methylophilus flavus TaxID=640084 RepID=A0ABW3PBI8_9PROT